MAINKEVTYNQQQIDYANQIMQSMTWESRVSKCLDDAERLGMDLSYSPEIFVKDIESDEMTANDNLGWLIARNSGIGGSDAGTVFGVNHYNTPASLAIEKINPITHGDRNNEPGKQYIFDFGHVNEAPVLNYFAAVTGFKVRTDRAMYQHPLYPFMHADCDGYAITLDGEKIIIECKTANYNTITKWKSGVWGKGAICPKPEYIYQCRHYMAVHNLFKAVILVTFGNNPNDIVFIWVLRDMEEEKALIDGEKQFWDNCQRGIIPSNYVVTDDQFEEFEKRVKKSNETDTVLPNSVMYDISEYEKYDSEIEAIKKKKKALEEEIKSVKEKQNAIKERLIRSLNGSSYGFIGDRVVTYVTTTKAKVDNDKLLRLYPEVYDDCNVGSKSSKFEILTEDAFEKKQENKNKN